MHGFSHENYWTMNSFQATDLFLYPPLPLKTSEMLWFSDVFRGYGKSDKKWIKGQPSYNLSTNRLIGFYMIEISALNGLNIYITQSVFTCIKLQ